MIQPGVGYTFTNDRRGSSLLIDTVQQAETPPLSVFEDSTAEGVAILRVSAGTINNSFPTINGTQVGQANAYFARPTSSSIVYLSIPASQSSGAPFPASTPSLILAGGSTIPSNSASAAYVGIAKIEAVTVPGTDTIVLTISQLTTGSLWGERFECGSQLDYWFAHI
jgi:hypothetical protein